MPNPEALLSAARARLGSSLDLLAELVEINTHADNAAGIASCHALLERELDLLDFDVDRVESSAPAHAGGPVVSRTHLVARSRAPRKDAPSVLLMGHLDTVFSPTHAFRLLSKEREEWRGPGVADMKGGIVTALLTLALLRELGALDLAAWRMVLASDEEQGSPTAARVVEEAAKGADVALCFEAARPCGGLVVARKGYGGVRVTARGKSGHAGIAHDTSPNALTALARLIVEAEALEGRFDDVSVSPGGVVEVSPDSVTSIPDLARCEIEWRFSKPSSGERVWSALGEIAAAIEREQGSRVELLGGVECPPMAPTPASDRLLACYVDAAARLGMTVRGVETAGVGDVNLVSKLGATCLDGVGPEGGGFHTDREFLVVDSIARRAAMNALALPRFLAELRAR